MNLSFRTPSSMIITRLQDRLRKKTSNDLAVYQTFVNTQQRYFSHGWSSLSVFEISRDDAEAAQHQRSKHEPQSAQINTLLAFLLQEDVHEHDNGQGG